MKFLVRNYSCLQNPEFLEPPPTNKIPGYTTDYLFSYQSLTAEVVERWVEMCNTVAVAVRFHCSLKSILIFHSCH